MNDKVKELVEWVAKKDYFWRICGIPDEYEAEWKKESLCTKQNCREFAREILSHPDLALIAPFSYSDKTPIYVAFQRKGEWCGVIPLAKVLKREEE